MRAYILKRNNQQSGPYSTHQLHNMGLLPTDQVRVAGSDIGWSFVDEIEELATFIVSSSIVTPNGLVSNNDILNESPISGQTSIHVSPPSGDIPTLEPWKKVRIEDHPVENRSGIGHSKPADPEQNTQHSTPEHTAKAEPGTPQGEKDIIEVIVTDDHWIFRDGVKMSLSSRKDIHIIGEAENGQQLLNILKHRKPDVILLDITMPVMDGLGALKAIRQTDKQTKVIVLSMHEGRSMVSSMMEAGANGYLTKTADPESIYQAIRTCHEKGYYFNDLTNVSILEGLRHGMPPVKKQEKTESKTELQPIGERPPFDEFNGGKILQKLAVSRKQEIKEKPKTSLQVTLVMVASLAFLVAGIWGGFWLKAHPEWLRLNTLVPEQQDNVRSQPQTNDRSPVKEISSDPLRQQPAVPLNANPTDSNTTQPSVTENSLNQPVANDLNSVSATVDMEKERLRLERKQARRTKDSLLKAQQAAAQIKVDTKPATVIEQVAVRPEPPAPAPKKVDISQVISQVSANANSYKVGVFGGLSKIEITVRNGSSVALDDVAVEVSYISANDNVFQTKVIHSGPLGASSTQVVPAPSSSRGARIEWHVIQVKPRE